MRLENGATRRGSAREPADWRLGRHVVADGDLSLRLVADSLRDADSSTVRAPCPSASPVPVMPAPRHGAGIGQPLRRGRRFCQHETTDNSTIHAIQPRRTGRCVSAVEDMATLVDERARRGKQSDHRRTTRMGIAYDAEHAISRNSGSAQATGQRRGVAIPDHEKRRSKSDLLGDCSRSAISIVSGNDKSLAGGREARSSAVEAPSSSRQLSSEARQRQSQRRAE